MLAEKVEKLKMNFKKDRQNTLLDHQSSRIGAFAEVVFFANFRPKFFRGLFQQAPRAFSKNL